MYKNNKLWNRYFPRSQRISYWYRETPWCPNIYFIDLNQFLLLFLLIITKQKYFSSSPRLFFFITLSLNLSRSLWFDLGTLRIILLWSPALGSEQALPHFLLLLMKTSFFCFIRRDICHKVHCQSMAIFCHFNLNKIHYHIL